MDKTYIDNAPLAAPALAINGAGLLVPKVTNTVATKIDGSVYAGVTAAALPAMTGINVPLLSTHAVAVMLSTAGVYSYVQANQSPSTTANGAATYSALLNTAITTGIYPTGLLPVPQPGYALIGWIIIKCASAATFTGGTTALDATNVTATYIDNFGVSGK